ncbi:MAG TPA: 50S ribosomal protein L10 [Candidatus Paceibacterota bacterium]|nr:50S ribosomal protein L10 [Candidatus Paceibacterota bacterium]
MPISKNKKQEILKKVTDAVKTAKSVVFVNFHGLGVADSTAVRRELRSKGVNYMVAKKTLTKKALEGEKFEGEMPLLEGELGLAFGDDLLSPAREIYEFQKKFDQKLSILGGIFEGKYKGKEEMLSIASIPPLQTLYAQFVNIINSPIAGLVVSLNAIADKKQS